MDMGLWARDSLATDVAAMPGLPPGLSSTIATIGQSGFNTELLAFLNRLCGAQHVHIFRFRGDHPETMTTASMDGSDSAFLQAKVYQDKGLWYEDPWYNQTRGDGLAHPVFTHLDAKTTDRRDLRNFLYERLRMRERVIIYGRGGDADIGLSMLRSEDTGCFTEVEWGRLRATYDVAFSMVVRHYDLICRLEKMTGALRELGAIEERIMAKSVNLPQREAQVAARILYGLTTEGIALDLDIGLQTVVTYRKRLYSRLEISSHRELLIWFLALWR